MSTLPALFEQLAQALEPHLRDALLLAFTTLQSNVDEPTLAAAIEQAGGDLARLERALAIVIGPRVVDASFQPLKEAMRAAVAAGGDVMASGIESMLAGGSTPPTPTNAARVGASLPPSGDTIRVQFNAVDPNVIREIQQAEFALFPRLADDARAGAKQLIADALAEGRGPAEIARMVRPMLGLSAYRAQIIDNARRELLGLRGAGVGDVLQRQLRDKRFDPTLRRVAAAGGELTPAQVDRMISAYTRKTLDHAALNFARTESINALRRAQRLAWIQAAESRAVDRAELVKTWWSRLDGRERESHHAMHGKTVGFDVAWDVPGIGPQQYPGESEYNCRCVSLVRPRWLAQLSGFFEGEPRENTEFDASSLPQDDAAVAALDANEADHGGDAVRQRHVTALLNRHRHGEVAAASLPPAWQEVIGSKSRAVRLSRSTVNSHTTTSGEPKHVEWTALNQARILPRLFAADHVFRERSDNLVFASEIDGQWWLAVVKATRDRERLYLQSFRRANARTVSQKRERATVVGRPQA